MSNVDIIEFTDGLEMSLRESKELNLFPRFEFEELKKWKFH